MDNGYIPPHLLKKWVFSLLGVMVMVLVLAAGASVFLMGTDEDSSVFEKKMAKVKKY